MHERGKIRNKDFKKQIFSFEGLRFGNITPTDIDGCIDFGNKLFVFFEAKYGDSGISRGQELALERLVNACHSPPARFAICFLVSHKAESDEISIAELPVTSYFYNGKWKTPDISGSTLLDGINAAREKLILSRR